MESSDSTTDIYYGERKTNPDGSDSFEVVKMQPNKNGLLIPGSGERVVLNLGASQGRKIGYKVVELALLTGGNSYSVPLLDETNEVDDDNGSGFDGEYLRHALEIYALTRGIATPEEFADDKMAILDGTTEGRPYDPNGPYL